MTICSNTKSAPGLPRRLAQAAVGLALLAAATGATAAPQDGLRAAPLGATRLDAAAQATPHWQARFGVAGVESADATLRLQGSTLQLLGDYYWQGFRPARFGLAGGFRATSGLLVGERALAVQSGTSLARHPGAAVSGGARGLRLGEAERELALAVPYVGVGYSGVSLRGGWGFTADLGLAGTGSGLQTRRDLPATSRGADEILRELRLTPVLQIGASYAF